MKYCHIIRLRKCCFSTSILILSSSSLGLATYTVEAKDNLNGEKPTTNLNRQSNFTISK